MIIDVGIACRGEVLKLMTRCFVSEELSIGWEVSLNDHN